MSYEMDQTGAGTYQIPLSNKEFLRLARNQWNGLDLQDWYPDRYDLSSPPVSLTKRYNFFCHAYRHAQPSRLRIHRWENTVSLDLVVPLNMQYDAVFRFSATLFPEEDLLQLKCTARYEARHDRVSLADLPVSWDVVFYIPLADAVHFGLVVQRDAEL